MTTVKSNLPANLFIAPPSLPVNVTAGVKLDLNPGQMVRAMVIESGLDGAVLEINRQCCFAPGEGALRVGQKLDLQVLQTQPRLEFRVLNDSLNDRLSQSLPLLTRAFDWSRLVGHLQLQPGQASLPPAIVNIYNQLQQMLNPDAEELAGLKGSIATIVTQLQQLSASGAESAGRMVSIAPVSLPQGQRPGSFELSQMITQLIKNLQNQLSLLPKQAEQLLSKNWHVETRKLLAPFQQGRELPQLIAPQRQLLVTVLQQIQQHSTVSPQLANEVERMLLQIDRQVAKDIFQSGVKAESGVAKEIATVATQQLNRGGPAAKHITAARGAAGAAQLSAEIKQLLGQVQAATAQKQGIAPELLGRLEGLLLRLQQLPHAGGKVPVFLPGFESIVSQLELLVSQRPTTLQGGQLGLLSQLFGFHLETELLQGKTKAALASLKLSLLGLQKESGEDVTEPLRRLELFQLCKAKLAEDQVQFLPLPFNELEEGYLLADRQSHTDDRAESQPPLQLSLSLRLSALGNIRVDMLYENRGLHLRLACEDRAKMAYLQTCTDELEESLQAIELQGISFSADAKLPARQLQERLLPDSCNILDARV